MPSFIHTITLYQEKQNFSKVRSTRRSNRRYVACLVATTTHKSLAINDAALVELRQNIKQEEARIEWLTGLLKLSHAEAEAVATQQAAAWWASYFDTKKEVIRRLAGTLDPRAGAIVAVNDDRVASMVREDLLGRGLVDPYAADSPHALCAAHSQLKFLAESLNGWQRPPLGSQAIISWHLTLANAQRALLAAEAFFWRQKGDCVELRTDIQVTEVPTKKG